MPTKHKAARRTINRVQSIATRGLSLEDGDLLRGWDAFTEVLRTRGILTQGQYQMVHGMSQNILRPSAQRSQQRGKVTPFPIAAGQ